MGLPRTAIVAALAHLDLDFDWATFREVLAATGVDAHVVGWDDPEVDWGAFDLAVVRGTWDAIARPTEYLAWLDRVSSQTTLANSPEVLRWGFDKGHLAELASTGIPTIETTWLRPGDRWSADHQHGEVVVKPVISGGTWDTARYAPHEAGAAAAHVERLLAEGRRVMVQPFLASVDRDGEAALIFVDGELSHAVRKGPILRPGEGVIQEAWRRQVITPLDLTGRQHSVATAVVDLVVERFGEVPLYARVDLLDRAPGDPCVLEVEVVDPSLFLIEAPGAPERFARAIARRAEHAADGRG